MSNRNPPYSSRQGAALQVIYVASSARNRGYELRVDCEERRISGGDPPLAFT
jgi:hypothetical protein